MRFVLLIITIKAGSPVINIYRPQRSWAKVIFSQVCVKNSVHRGGGCLSQCMLGYTPPGQTPPGSRHPPGVDPPLEQSPPRADTLPPGSRPPHPGKQTAAYGQRAAGTHPTGMHSCSHMISEVCGNISLQNTQQV